MGLFEGLSSLFSSSIETMNALGYKLQVFLEQVSLTGSYLIFVLIVVFYFLTFRLFLWLIWKFFPYIFNMFDFLNMNQQKDEGKISKKN